MLQQNGLVLRDTKFCSYVGNFLCAHHKVPKELSLYRVFRDEAELRKGKLLLFGKVVKECTGKQQAAVDDIPVKAGQEISRFHHGRSVHQKSGDKAVVDAFSGRNRLQGLLMAGHHRAADLPVISIRNRTDQSLHFCHRSVHINGSHRDQGGQVVSIIVVSQTDPIDSNLRGASELGDSATDLHNIAFICRGDGARIVPYFYFDGAGSIRQRGTQKRLAGSGRLRICSFQNIEALHLIR